MCLGLEDFLVLNSTFFLDSWGAVMAPCTAGKEVKSFLHSLPFHFPAHISQDIVVLFSKVNTLSVSITLTV
jgi:hypothetical protein